VCAILWKAACRAAATASASMRSVSTLKQAHTSGRNVSTRTRADIFDMQDEITTRLARTVGIELVAAEGRRAERERPNNMDAVDLAMRGWAILNQPLSLRRDRDACKLFEAALRRDDRNIEALIGLALYHTNDLRTFASTNRDEQLCIAEKAITEALVLAPGSALAHFVHANVLRMAVLHGCVGLTGSRRLPVYPREQTFSG